VTQRLRFGRFAQPETGKILSVTDRVVEVALGRWLRHPAAVPYMIIQAMVLASELLVEPMVNDPVPRERTNGVPIAAEGPMLVR
jgi:hypothetical protein